MRESHSLWEELRLISSKVSVVNSEINCAEEWAGLWYENLDLSIAEVDGDFAALDNDAIAADQDIAKSFTLGEAGVRDILVDLTVSIVGQCNEELSTSECVQGVIDPLFCEWVVVALLGLSSFVNGLDKFEYVMVAVEVSPHDFTVVGVVTATKGLLATVVEEWNTSGSQSESKCTLELSMVSVGVKESWVVVVVDEKSKCVNISEVLVVGVPSVSNVSHGFAVHPDVSDWVVHRVVEECANMILVVTNIGIISIEDLSHLEDSSGLGILAPEVLWYLRDGVDTDSIEIVLLNKVLDPVL